MWRHDGASFARMWKEVGVATGTRWDVNATLDEIAGFGGLAQGRKWQDATVRFEVQRVDWIVPIESCTTLHHIITLRSSIQLIWCPVRALDRRDRLILQKAVNRARRKIIFSGALGRGRWVCIQMWANATAHR